LILGLLTVSTGCTSTTDTTLATEEVILPTAVTLSPQAFLGSVPCSNEAGALRSYVAKLFDFGKSQADAGSACEGLPSEPVFPLPASAPTPCSADIVFRYVVVDHCYRASIAGYDLSASDLTPAGHPSSGSSTMVRKTDGPEGPKGTPVAPRWTSSCDEPVRAVLDDDVFFAAKDCSPLKDMGSARTGIRVDPKATLGLLGCEGKGRVDTFDITAPDPAIPKRIEGLFCGDGPADGPVKYEHTYEQGIEPGKTYTFTVTAHRSDDFAGQNIEASCSARAQAGLIVTAVCDLLNPVAAP
jgi:hypothetical protein